MAGWEMVVVGGREMKYENERIYFLKLSIQR